eukprot:7381530-Prymnesium_polylepis.3
MPARSSRSQCSLLARAPRRCLTLSEAYGDEEAGQKSCRGSAQQWLSSYPSSLVVWPPAPHRSLCHCVDAQEKPRRPCRHHNTILPAPCLARRPPLAATTISSAPLAVAPRR